MAQHEDIRTFLPYLPASGKSAQLQKGEGVTVSCREGKLRAVEDSELSRVGDAKTREYCLHGLVLRELH